MNDKNPHENLNRPYDRNPNAKPNPYDQNPHKKPNPNRNSIIIAVCITVAACAVIGVSLFFLISTLNKQNDTPKPTETTESSVQVTQASVNVAGTVASTAAPPSTAVPPSTAKPTEAPPVTEVIPATAPPSEVIGDPPAEEDVAAELFQRLSGRELMFGFVHGSQIVTVNSDGTFSMLYHHLIYDNNIRTMQYFSEAGSFSNVRKLNDFTYSMHIADAYTTTSDADAEKVSAGYPTKAVEDSFGFYGGGEALVYMPEAPLSQIPESVLNKGGKMKITPNGDVLGYYCLVDAKGARYYSKAY